MFLWIIKTSIFTLFLVATAFAQPAQKKLIVGMELSYPPFEMTDKNGEPSGVSVEMAKSLAQHLGRELKIENISYDGLIPSLKTGKVDCIISSMTATKERARSVDFSNPYLKTGLSLLVSNKSKINSIKDINHPSVTVVVKKGTTGHQYATENLKKTKLLILDKESSAVLEVAQGKADSFIYDELSVFKHHRRNPTSTRAILEPFKIESWAIAVKKGDTKLLEQINFFLETYKKDGGFERLGDQFLSEEKKLFKKMGVPFFF